MTMPRWNLSDGACIKRIVYAFSAFLLLPLCGCRVVDDFSVCLSDDMCQAEQENPCVDRACVDGHCISRFNNNSCDDGDPCTHEDVCDQGTCQGVPCPEGQTCGADGQCVAPPAVAFASPIVLDTAGSPLTLATADVDSDGDLDLIVGNGPLDLVEQGNVAILRNHGSRAFGPATAFQLSFRPKSLGAGDLDNDGVLDFIASGDEAAALAVDHEGDVTDAYRLDLGPVWGLSYVAVNDLDGDGRLDVVTANANTDDISVLLGRGPFEFAPAAVYPLAEDSLNGYLFSGPILGVEDVDGDTYPDVVTIDIVAGAVVVMHNDGSGRLGAPRPVWMTSDLLQFIVVQDTDGDGDTDLVVATSYPPTIAILSNDGSGCFEGIVQQLEHLPTTAVICDFNGDGQLDVALLSGRDGLITILETTRGQVHETLRIPIGAEAVFLAADDLDGDGRCDLAVASEVERTLSVYFNETQPK